MSTSSLLEFIDDVQDQTQNNADDDARGQGEEKRIIFFFDQDVSGKLADKGKSREDQKHESDQDQNRPEENHDLCDLSHDTITIPDTREPKDLPLRHEEMLWVCYCLVLCVFFVSW